MSWPDSRLTITIEMGPYLIRADGFVRWLWRIDGGPWRLECGQIDPDVNTP